MRSYWAASVSAVVTFVLLVGFAHAQPSLTTEVRESFQSAGTRLQFGYGEWATPYGTLRQRWDLWLTEVSAELAYDRLVGRFTLGFGVIPDGVFGTQSVNTVPHVKGVAGLQGPPARSALGGDLWRVRPEVGLRTPVLLPRLQLDLLAGLLYERTYFRGMGAQGTLFGTITHEPIPAAIPTSHRTTTETLQWLAPTVSARGRYRLTDRLEVTGTLTGIPWFYTQTAITRPWREDLRTPALVGNVIGGWGVLGEAGASYRLGHGVSLSAGVTYDRLVSGQGGDQFHARLVNQAPLAHWALRVRDERWGPWIGLRYEW